MTSEELACLRKLSATPPLDEGAICPICGESLDSDSIGELVTHIGRCESAAATPCTTRAAP